MARDFKALERRRLRAARLLDKGHTQPEAAFEVGVSRQSLSRWHRRLRAAGREGLKSTAPAGRPPRLTPAQQTELQAALLRGYRHSRYGPQRWTLPRVAALIRQLSGLRPVSGKSVRHTGFAKRRRISPCSWR